MNTASVLRLVLSLTFGAGMALAAMQAMASQGDPLGAQGPGGGSGPAGEAGGSNKKIPAKKLQAYHDRFEISLHATRRGKARFYSAYWDIDGDGVLDDNGGFEQLAMTFYGDHALYENLGCKNCHYPPAVASPDTDTDDTLSPGDCTDCHWNFSADDYGVPAFTVPYCDLNADPGQVEIGICPDGYDPATRFTQDDVCLGCHGRQAAEHKLLTDVHRTIDATNPGEMPKFTCMGCHQETEVHGDGTERDSHLDNPKTSCAQSGCHERELKIAGGKKATGGACKGDSGKVNERCETFHVQHVADVDCTACHVQSNTTCNSCHFDSEIDERKRFYRQIPAKGFLFLMNFKDIQDPSVTKVRSATYQSLTVGAVCVDGNCDTEGAQTFAVFAPYAAHAVIKGEELGCMDCHAAPDGNGGYVGNPEVVRYFTDGYVQATKWNEGANCSGSDPGVDPATGCLEGPAGIIPVPHDWLPDDGGALMMDFAYYLGNTTDPVQKNPAGDQWDFLKTGPDAGHMPYGKPLSEDQMLKLILDQIPE
jgi:hypothetical protein